jgi:hypothetical protein
MNFRSIFISILGITTVGFYFIANAVAQEDTTRTSNTSPPSSNLTKPVKKRIPEYMIPGEKIQRVSINSMLAGKIISADGNASETACSSILVTLNDLIPGQTTSDFGAGLVPNKIAQVNATGSTLNNGCMYSLNHGISPLTKPVIKRDDRASYEIKATAPIKNPTCSFSETKQFKEIPSTLDLAMAQSCLR